MLEKLSEHRCFEGTQEFYRHDSKVIGLPMRFSVYRPPQAKTSAVPVLYFLAGLTSTDETFMIKSGAQRFASRFGMILVSPDTSPRNTGILGEDKDWEIGSGAGFYVNATQTPWSSHFRMYDYILHELRELILKEFPAAADRTGIFGHSMGGHGALVLALRNPEIYRSVSAFAPIVTPSRCPWGIKAFTRYLGENRESWGDYDATELMKKLKKPFENRILVDQGLNDPFLNVQLFPEDFQTACQLASQPLTLRRQPGYDHNYYFISTFIEDHLAWHNALL